MLCLGVRREEIDALEEMDCGGKNLGAKRRLKCWVGSEN
jgi:hypothetical protein